MCRHRVVPFGDDDAILTAFREDGYVVVSDVLSPRETEDALDEIWSSETLLGRFDRNDPETWGDPSWPQQEGPGGRNFLASGDAFSDACSWDISSCPRQFQLQKLLWGRDDLVMSSPGGRWGVMRPSGRNSKWRTDSNWLHWDQNPWTEPRFVRVQAIVCLTESTPTSGGFACVPGFHRERFRKWGEDHPMGTLTTTANGKLIDESYGNGQPFPVPSEDPCQREIVQALAPAGSMILWDSRLPHQNVPNVDDEAFRVVFYCNMVIAKERLLEERRRLLTQKRILMDLRDGPGRRFPYGLAELGKRLHGWTGSSDADAVPLSEALAKFGIDDRESFLEAATLTREAGLAEEEGDVPASIQKHRAALRAFPDIEAWHNVIFG